MKKNDLCTAVKLASSVIMFLVAGLVASENAEACSCLPSPPPADEYQRSIAVFSGTILSIDVISLPEGSQMLKVGFAVVESWKGISGDTATVLTALNTAACGYPFESDSSYLIYCIGRLDTLETGLCQRTRLLSEASEDLAYLSTLTHVEDRDGRALPPVFALRNFPNPANPSTQFSISLSRRSTAVLEIYSLSGERLERVFQGDLEAGNHVIPWTPAGLASGIYLARLTTNTGSVSRRVVFLR